MLAPQVDQIGRNFTSKLYQPGVSILVSPPPCVCLPEPPHSMMDIKRERRVESESAGCVDGASPAPRTPSVYLADVVACERERERANGTRNQTSDTCLTLCPPASQPSPFLVISDPGYAATPLPPPFPRDPRPHPQPPLQDEIIAKGTTGAGCLYIIEAGRVDIIVSKQGKDEVLVSPGIGEYFGEVSLMFPDNVRTAGVVAGAEGCTCLQLSGAAWEHVKKLPYMKGPARRLGMTARNRMGNKLGVSAKKMDRGAAAAVLPCCVVVCRAVLCSFVVVVVVVVLFVCCRQICSREELRHFSRHPSTSILPPLHARIPNSPFPTPASRHTPTSRHTPHTCRRPLGVAVMNTR